ncbi:MAG TPA: Flp pilus assembly protein CpaB [Tepidisphaeraceae bacterium]|jgi:pilus assembly protein CpaB|nr:Flp pilus assembly protein CpaB [Tepidisphaeraceae bacterium]
MNWKAWAPLAVAIVLGLVAAITARNLVNHRPAPVAVSTGSQIVFVKQPILPGQEIKADDLTTASLAWKEIPEGTFKNPSDVIGRVATSPLVKGEPVLEALLAPAGTASGLQALVPEGMRAITIEVNEFSGVAGLIEPGCSVDVVATLEDPKSKEHLARTIVQNVKVMAVGQRTFAPAAKDSKDLKDIKDPAALAAAAAAAGPDPLSKSVTLLTTPTEAETLELASMIGRPRLILRGQRDVAAAVSNGVSDSQLAALTNDSADSLAPSQHAEIKPVLDHLPATRPSLPDQQIVKIYKGGVESTVTFNVRRATDESQSPPEVLTGADTGPAIPH